MTLLRAGLCLLIGTCLACAPQAEEASAPAEVAETVPLLLGYALAVPTVEGTFVAVDEMFLAGELTSYASGAGSGTLRLLSRPRDWNRHLVFVLELSRVGRAPALYLAALKQSGATFSQLPAIPLGTNRRLIGLRLEAETLSVSTADARLGKAPASGLDVEAASFVIEAGALKRLP